MCFTQFQVPSEENARPSEDPSQVQFLLRTPTVILKQCQGGERREEGGKETHGKIIVRNGLLTVTVCNDQCSHILLFFQPYAGYDKIFTTRTSLPRHRGDQPSRRPLRLDIVNQMR